MPETIRETAGARPDLSRRRWLVGSLAAAWALVRLGDGNAAPADPPDDEVTRILARAKAAKLRGFHSRETEHYLGVGDARKEFCDQALKICKALGGVYQKHFRDKGFPVEFPDRRLTVITLKDQASYSAFLGEAPGANVGGHYDLDSNWLVVFDFRPDAQDLATAPERVNTFTLIHEALHQLMFNTGLLNRQGDVPVAVSEGLAMYGELWRPTARRGALGQVNKPRLAVITEQTVLDDAWIPIDRLLTEDALFSNAATEQMAYAQSWALVHLLMRPGTRIAKFRDYLAALRERRDPKLRLKDAKAHLGDLTRLDRDVKHHAVTSS